MKSTLILFLMGEARFQIFIYLVIGLLAYFIDYKKFTRTNDTRREAKFSKAIALTYIYGSIALFVAMQVGSWLI